MKYKFNISVNIHSLLNTLAIPIEGPKINMHFGFAYCIEFINLQTCYADKHYSRKTRVGIEPIYKITFGLEVHNHATSD